MIDQKKKQKILEEVYQGTLTPKDASKYLLEYYRREKSEEIGDRSVVTYVPEWMELENAAVCQENVKTILVVSAREKNNAIPVLKEHWNGCNIIAFVDSMEYMKVDSNQYQIRLSKEEDYEAAFMDMKQHGLTPDFMLFFSDQSEEEEDCEQQYFSLQYLVRQQNKVYGQYDARLYYVYTYLCIENQVRNYPVASAAASMLKSVFREYPRLQVKTLGLPSVNDLQRNVKLLSKEMKSGNHDFEVQYFDSRRYVHMYRVCEEMQEFETEFKESGIYLLIGGLGGLGYELAKDMAKNKKNRLILIGSSQLTEKKRVLLNEIKAEQAEVTYLQADVTDHTSVQAMVEAIRHRYGNINGVFYCAGRQRDALLVHKTDADAKSVLEPKIRGIRNLDKALATEKLSFFVVFSSIAAVVGNRGQCDYAFANGYLDGFARWRNQLISQGVRYGKTIVINWSLWETSKAGGMSVDTRHNEMMEEMGSYQMPMELGIKLTRQIIASDARQKVVIYGVRDKIVQVMEGATGFISEQKNQTSNEEAALQVKTILKEILYEISKIPVEQMDDSMTFEDYGLDSVMVSRFNQAMEVRFGGLPKTLLYQYNTIDGLSGYLAANFPNVVKKSEILPKEEELTRKPSQAIEKVITEKREEVSENQDDIAIIGLSGRYPEAENLVEFWEKLIKGEDSITEIPEERWDYRKYYSTNPEDAKIGKIYCKWGAFLRDVDKFDTLLFGISPREAELMDPQERIFLETAWSAMEDAGYTRNQCKEFCAENQRGQIGVFAGVTTNTYMLFGPEEWRKHNMVIPNSLEWSMANRVSYTFNLNGPSIPVDTACSSSLTAVHLACESLRHGECRMAIAGGVNLYLHPSKYLSMCQLNMLSPTGKCHTFGKDADGFVPGEGVGAVILKPLSEAKKDHDHIYAVIKATSINHGGKTSGYTVPNPNAQSDLIMKALNKSNVDVETIQYIEAHGTGTQLGDPIEIAGLTKAYQAKSDKKNYCAIGSVKSNIGHLEGAAGIASLTKVLLQMKYKKLVPSIHCEQLNSNINFEQTPFYVQKKYEEWNALEKDARKLPRRAAISAFGAGGANAHVILEEYVAEERKTNENGSFLIVLSAKTEEQLKRYATMLQEDIERKQSEAEAVSVRDIAYTLFFGREPMEERLALVADNEEDLVSKLRSYNDDSGNEIDWVRTRCNKNDSKKSFSREEKEKAEHWMHAGEWLKIGEAWCQGYDITSYMNLQLVDAYRTSLPTYPFQKERYWIRIKEEEINTSPQRMEQLIEKKKIEEEGTLIFYQDEWEERQLIEQAKNEANVAIISSMMSQEEWKKKIDSTFCATKPFLIYDLSFVQDRSQEKSLTTILTHLFSMGQELCDAKLYQYSMYIVPIVLGSCYEIYSKAILGFMKSILQEKGRLYVKLILCDQKDYGYEDWVRLCQKEAVLTNKFSFVRYLNGKREISVMRKKQLEQKGKNTVFAKNRTYLITGGLGALGTIFAKYLVEHYQANVILTGRSAESEKTEEKLRLIGPADKVHYCKADVSKLNEFRDAIVQAEKMYGTIDGVIHAAGINRDRYLLQKEQKEFMEVVQTKVLGIHHIDAVFQNRPLDFILSFSSIAAAIGNAGQSDYAFANGYINSFSEIRNQMVAQGQRFGKTISFCWPYWDTDGMKIQPQILEVLQKQFGIRPMPPEKGVEAFEQCLQNEMKNPIIFYGEAVKIEETIRNSHSETKSQTSSGSHTLTNGYVKEKAREFLAEAFEEILHLNKGKIKDDTRFEEYGIDSITIGQFNSLFEQKLKEESKTLLYEYQTLEELTDYVANVHENEILELYPMLPSENHATQQTVVSEKIESQKEEEKSSGDIAIIGLAGRYPGADDMEAFWENLIQGIDSVTEIPEGRWDWKKYYEPDVNQAEEGKIYCKWGGFLDQVDKFDPLLFHMSKKEADIVDPQERLFLQTVWSAIEDAGYTKATLQKTTNGLRAANVGVFAGVTTNTYLLYGPEEWKKSNMVNPSSFEWSIANRVSYIFNFRGPSIPVDTACSSSLSSIHLACESLNRGECKMAIAGGVNLYLHPAKYLYLSALRMLSPTGRCHVFGSESDGFVPGEGVGAVVLRPLEDAIKNKDHIYGVIKGSAVNHGGNTNGYTVPNPVAQTEVIQEAMSRAGVKADSISYIEAHGTGTQLGDPIEIKGLTNAFHNDTDRLQYCAIGSVKSNIGHLEAAAGIASLTKVLLQMKYGKLVPTLTHSKSLNDKIIFEKTPFYVQQDCTDWKINKSCGADRRRAGISAFGAGGANAHVIVEEYKEEEKQEELKQRTNVFVLSAQSKEILDTYAMSYVKFLKEHAKTLSFSRLCYTLQFGRSVMEERLAIVAADIDELGRKLEAYLNEESMPGTYYANAEDMHLEEGKHETKEEALARNWANSETVDFSVFYDGQALEKLSIPTYPFEQMSCWFESKNERTGGTLKQRLRPMLDENQSVMDEVRFSKRMSDKEFYVRDHLVQQKMVLPGAAYLEMMYEACNYALEGKCVQTASEIYWLKPFIVDKDRELKIRIQKQNQEIRCEVYDQEDIGQMMKRYCTGVMSMETSLESTNGHFYQVLDIMEHESPTKGTDCYEAFQKAGLNYQESFRVMKEVWAHQGRAVSRIELPNVRRKDAEDFFIHPCLLDGAFQSVMVLMSNGMYDENTSYLPYYIAKITRFAAIPAQAIVYVSRDENEYTDENQMSFEIEIYDRDGKMVARIHRYTIRALKSEIEFADKTKESKDDENKDNKEPLEMSMILKMLEEGTIGVEEAERLLQAIQ